jgi:type IV pilus assembly protein PilY1
VLGGGYDATAEDASPPSPSSTMGKAVFVLDAISGALIKTLPTARSVPASVTLMDTDYDGYVDRAYAVDMGGTVYRIDFETGLGGNAPVNWAINAFANLGNASTPRKFFYDPDVVQTNEFVAVMVGSGNRERPLLATTGDRWYTLFDYSLGKGPTGLAAISDESVVPYASYDPTAHPPGCYIPMDPAGEKVVTGTVSTGGNSYFATNMPIPVSATSCQSNLGLAKTYQVPLFCGQPKTQQLAGGGLPPTPVTGYVEVTYSNPNNPQETGTRTVPFIIGGPNPVSSGIGASRVPIVVDPTRRRTYWYTNTNH